jgi:hypothetical protein
VAPGIDFKNVSDVLSGKGGDTWEELAGWRVDPTHLQVPITTGAGQFRAVGRTIGLAYAEKINSALQTAANRLSSAEAPGQLAEISQLAGYPGSAAAEPVVVVVSSLAGGTGAGLVLDVCDLLRQLNGGWGGNSFGILYGSDVFREIAQLSTAGIQPNSLAAMSELLNGYWLTDNDKRVNRFFRAAGAPRPIGRSGPAFPFLVGASNAKGVSFGDQKSVYAMMGRALTSWVTDPTVQDELVAYTIGNWENSARGNIVTEGVLTQNHLPVFDAFGYAEVNLGVERFQQYATLRLAKLAATWLHEGHLQWARSLDKEENRPQQAIIDDIAREQLVGFLVRTGLHERGSEQNQIIDALQPVDAEALFEAAVRTVLEQVTAGIRDLNKDAWTERIYGFLAGVVEEYERDYDERIRLLAGDWVQRAPGRVLDATVEMIGRFGLPTTHRLLQLVAEELKSVVSELTEETKHYLAWANDARGAITSELTISGRIRPQQPAVEEAVRAGVWTQGHYLAEARRRQVAAQLMMEFCDGFIAPLAKAVGAANSELRLKGFTGDGQEPPHVLAWPDEAVPDSLAPPKNERLVIGIDQFPEHFRTLLARSTLSELADEKIREARAAVITGAFLQDEAKATRDRLQAITPTSPWAPDPSLLLGVTTLKSAARFALAFGPEAVRDRAEAWLRRQGTAFDRFLSSDLRSYLDDDTVDPEEMAKRRGSFRMALTAALDSSEPLVQLDQALVSLLHPNAKGGQRSVPSKLPFRDHPMQRDVEEILHHRLGGNQPSMEKYLSTSTNVDRISIPATLGAAHDPLVFTSITEPIITGWGKAAASPPAKTAFWTNRRARPLSEFIPAPQGIILAMARGWFTGLLLGKINREDRLILDTSNKVAVFPDPLLRTPNHVRDVLPALLESLGLAYSEVARLQSLDPLRPYVALRELGVPRALDDYQEAHQYDELNQVLAGWLRTGDYGDTLEPPLAQVTGSPELANVDDRVKAAREVVRRSREGYQSAFATYQEQQRSDPSRLGPSHGQWPGMYGLIVDALSQLEGGLESFADDETVEM